MKAQISSVSFSRSGRATMGYVRTTDKRAPIKRGVRRA
jgi:hypothetical protein